MTEDFLHYLWRHQHFTTHSLQLRDGRQLQIKHPGYTNPNAGPDFSNARLKIEDQEWAGQVEIHIQSGDWYQHQHQNDPAYQSVILHVVYEYTQAVYYQGNQEIPTLELKGIIDEYLYWRYEQMVQTSLSIPCAGNVKEIDGFLKLSMQERALIERLEKKKNTILTLVEHNQGDWYLTYYQWFSRAFGLKVNAEPMLMLARQLSPQIVLRLNSLLQTEALFLGMAGFLETARDDYSNTLKQEFTHLKNKYKLHPLASHIWKYARLRPPAFPEFRIALLAAFWFKNQQPLDFKLLFKTLDSGPSLFAAEASNYWKTHYRLGKTSARPHAAKLGQTTVNTLLINVAAPFRFAYGKAIGDAQAADGTFELLHQIVPEQNKITQLYQKLGFENKDAVHSQGLIALHEYYCKPKACLKCSLGIKILKSTL